LCAEGGHARNEKGPLALPGGGRAGVTFCILVREGICSRSREDGQQRGGKHQTAARSLHRRGDTPSSNTEPAAFGKVSHRVGRGSSSPGGVNRGREPQWRQAAWYPQPGRAVSPAGEVLMATGTPGPSGGTASAGGHAAAPSHTGRERDPVHQGGWNPPPAREQPGRDGSVSWPRLPAAVTLPSRLPARTSHGSAAACRASWHLSRPQTLSLTRPMSLLHLSPPAPPPLPHPSARLLPAPRPGARHALPAAPGAGRCAIGLGLVNHCRLRAARGWGCAGSFCSGRPISRGGIGEGGSGEGGFRAEVPAGGAWGGAQGGYAPIGN